MIQRDRWLRWFLRITGSVSMLAVVAVVMPHAWMNAIHQRLGMGPLPAEPIVGYLARSTSAFYTVLGGLMWVASFDLTRYRPIVSYVGAAIILLGVALLAVDSVERMPWWWRSFEGPANMLVGAILLALSLRKSYAG